MAAAHGARHPLCLFLGKESCGPPQGNCIAPSAPSPVFAHGRVRNQSRLRYEIKGQVRGTHKIDCETQRRMRHPAATGHQNKGGDVADATTCTRKDHAPGKFTQITSPKSQAGRHPEKPVYASKRKASDDPRKPRRRMIFWAQARGSSLCQAIKDQRTCLSRCGPLETMPGRPRCRRV
jgi:hypothetical protein